MVMNKFRRFLQKREEVISTLIALVIAFLIIAILLISTGRPAGEAFYYFLKGAFGNVENTSNTISRVIPLTIAGIAFLIGAKCAVFNVGVEGQLILGAMASAIVGYVVHLPKILHLPLMLCAGMAAGGLYAFIPAWLKTKRNVNEILSTIMLNYPATYLTHFLVLKVLPMEGIVPATPFIDDTARFKTLIDGTRLHGGFVVAILVVVFAYFLLQKTSLGYEMRAVGANKEAARFHGIPVEKRMVTAFMLSGALAGLAGAVEVAGVHYRFLDQFSPGYGYDAITVAMVGLMNPIGVVLSATLFGALKTGILDMSIYTEIPRQLTTLINGIVVLLVASKEMIRVNFAKLVRSKDEFKQEKE
jgi:ABC-type uncharacterized transport system permease subunit